MNHAKLLQTSGGMAYEVGHHWNHILGFHLLRGHHIIVSLLLGFARRRWQSTPRRQHAGTAPNAAVLLNAHLLDAT